MNQHFSFNYFPLPSRLRNTPLSHSLSLTLLPMIAFLHWSLLIDSCLGALTAMSKLSYTWVSYVLFPGLTCEIKTSPLGKKKKRKLRCNASLRPHALLNTSYFLLELISELIPSLLTHQTRVTVSVLSSLPSPMLGYQSYSPHLNTQRQCCSVFPTLPTKHLFFIF